MSDRNANVNAAAAIIAATAMRTRTAGDARRRPSDVRELLVSGMAPPAALSPTGVVLGSGEAEVIVEPSSLARSASLVERCTVELASRRRFVIDDNP
jgi:hypothetical protein